MKVVMVVESMFGHTQVLAESVADGLRDQDAEVVLLRAGDATDHALRGVDLLVLAGPTHALSMSRASTRADAVAQGADDEVATSGIREWLATLDDEAPAGEDAGVRRPPVAVFDTRSEVVRHVPGSASRAIRRQLRRRGFTVVERTSFFVDGVTGPIVDGEVERARSWGQALVPPV